MSSQDAAVAPAVLQTAAEDAKRIRNELATACQSWHIANVLEEQIVEFSDKYDSADPIFLVSVHVARSCLRDAVAGLMRITDQPQTDLQTVVGVRKKLTLVVFDPDLHGPQMSSEEFRSYRDFLFGLVPPSWKDASGLTDTRLLRLREEFKIIRDSLIAHSGPYNAADVVQTVRKVGSFIELMWEVETAISFLCALDESVSPNADTQMRAGAYKFWSKLI